MANLEATLFLDLDGTALTTEEERILTNPLIGGVILFARNTQSAHQVKQLVESIRAIRPETIISIDQEGGRVQRLKEGVTRLPPVQSLNEIFIKDRDEGLAAAKELGYLMAAEMRMLDIDISYAPVLDIDYGHNEVIGNRAFSDDIDAVIALSGSYIEGMSEAGMAATGKHFPGHGWVSSDTHLEGAVDTRSFEELCSSDLKPFQQAIDNQIEAMMLAHVTYPECDELPAGYSRFWLCQILKEKLNYQGIIFSDDLCMKAAHSAGTYTDRVKAALDAGCQAILCCNERQGTLEILEYMHSVNCSPLDSLACLKGRLWALDEKRLHNARLMAERLLTL
ncbi:MAG: beta-N-acetylhexosaminidase [Neptuniibacter sp.]